jgi:hypothetical protein
MSNFTEVVHWYVQFSGLQVGMGRTPPAEASQAAAPARLQEVAASGAQIADARHKVVPSVREHTGP